MSRQRWDLSTITEKVGNDPSGGSVFSDRICVLGPKPESPVEVMPVSEFEDAWADARELAYAIFRSNIDWAEAARACGDPKCNGDCRHVADIRRLVEKIDGGILPGPHSASPGHRRASS